MNSNDKYLEDFKRRIEVQRIRRITGYLTGDVTQWNDAKKAELNDRVKHVYIKK